jgi:hypothetical protein
MLVASFRELQTHAEKIRQDIATLLGARGSLAGRCAPDKFGNVVNVQVSDTFDQTSGPLFATSLTGVLASYFETWNAISASDFARG